ncbi:guanine nucleotide exchange factor MSS4-like [Saccostrea echinata]|uniref:guanine nucleotide exchange factor MSS4-like n=1 Tax=Saccostrea echinata TaxID=191078 RepID=UPI002A82D874|nr:guanine nucleotide exchange factor MSS4-like [Saccostrea echinata]
MTSEESTAHENFVENGKNKTKLFCERCSSTVLLPKKAVYCEVEFFMPHMKKKADGTSETGETLKKYWKVDDMFEFENLGFTNTVETIKYLICADCEIGPIGWHDINDKKAFYIALDRVKHAE